MQRTLITDCLSLVGQKVKVAGWINSIRRHGHLIFVDLRDRSGILQIICDKNISSQLKEESVVEFEGLLKNREANFYNDKIITGKIEMEATSFNLLASAHDLPFDVHAPDLNVSLPVILDNRAASLRHQKSKDVFIIQAAIAEAFRSHLNQSGFTEIFIPTIVAGSTEGGSQVFPIDYFGYQAYLAQSPQLYKQIMVSIFERVYTLAHAYRAEPSVTTRHLTEYVGLDVEMGFIDSWLDVVKTADLLVKSIFNHIEKNYSHILKEYNTTVPKTIENTPIIKLSEALKIVSERTGRHVENELDMDPESEREICRWSYEKFGSEMVFITHFYTKKRAWYSKPDPANLQETLTFDLIGRGVEWISGGQRINDYQQLIDRIKEKGMDLASFDAYIQAFKYGMPPEGGFCIGLERITTNLLNLTNLRYASLYPRDMERIDGRLSIIGQKSTHKTVDLYQKIINYLNENSVIYKSLEHEETKTSADSARVRGTSLEQGAKALLMIGDDKPILAVLSAAKKLDNNKFKKLSDIKNLKMATADEVEKISSVPIGAVPPFGNLFGVSVFVDQNLLTNEQIAFNAGSKTKSVIMPSSDFVKLVNPTIGDFSE